MNSILQRGAKSVPPKNPHGCRHARRGFGATPSIQRCCRPTLSSVPASSRISAGALRSASSRHQRGRREYGMCRWSRIQEETSPSFASRESGMPATDNSPSLLRCRGCASVRRYSARRNGHARHGPPGEYGFNRKVPAPGVLRRRQLRTSSRVRSGLISPQPASMRPMLDGLPQPLADQAPDGRRILDAAARCSAMRGMARMKKSKPPRTSAQDKYRHPADHRVDERQQEVKAMVERRARFAPVHHGVAARGKLCSSGQLSRNDAIRKGLNCNV